MMERLASRAIRTLPEPLRLRLLRATLRIPPLPGAGTTFRIARTPQEREAAARLLHDCYVRAGLMTKDPQGRRRTRFQDFPGAVQAIALQENSDDAARIIATASLIPDLPGADSEGGLPSDSAFRRENDRLRQQGYRLVEASGLAVAPEFRCNRNQLTLYLAKFLYQYLTRNTSADLLCATVHPRAYDFYAGLMGFRRSGPEVSYDEVNGARAIHLSLPLKAGATRLREVFTHSDPFRNFSLFLGRDEPLFELSPCC
ncbi:MAG: hypothetical protein NDJ89_15420 [Oligoflexia bacterium]|nr:hypothetical protein [Oligoflexia bacterium]